MCCDACHLQPKCHQTGLPLEVVKKIMFNLLFTRHPVLIRRTLDYDIHPHSLEKVIIYLDGHRDECPCLR